jgi:hypothetical protein
MRHSRAFILAAVAFVSCSGKYYYKTNVTEEERQQMKVIVIDSSYDFFVREVYRDTSDARNFDFNVNDLKKSRRELIEMQQLLISSESGNIVYITTIPDPRQKYYSSRIVRKQVVNIEDIYRVHFGKIKSNCASFVTDNRGRRNEWELVGGDGMIRIKRIAQWKRDDLENEINIEEALQPGVTFVKTEFDSIALIRRKSELRINADKEISFKLNKKRNVRRMYFHLQSPIIKGKSSYGDVYFKKLRIRTSPCPLFE